MIRVARYVAGAAVLDFSGSMREAIPDRFAFAVFVPRAFDLISGGRCAPEEILREGDAGRSIEPWVVGTWGGRGTPYPRRIRRHAAGREQAGGQRGCNPRGDGRLRKLSAGQRQGRKRLLQSSK